MDHVYCFHFYVQVYNEVSILSGPSMKHERVKLIHHLPNLVVVTLNLVEKSSNT